MRCSSKINFLTHTTCLHVKLRGLKAVTLWYSLLFSFECGTSTNESYCACTSTHICGRQKEKEAERLFSGHHPLLRSLIILAFFSSKYRSHSLSCSVSFTSLPFSSLQWFDVPNHFQPWTPHERQQALAVIGCWKNERGRGQKRGETLEEKAEVKGGTEVEWEARWSLGPPHSHLKVSCYH